MRAIKPGQIAVFLGLLAWYLIAAVTIVVAPTVPAGGSPGRAIRSVLRAPLQRIRDGGRSELDSSTWVEPSGRADAA